MTDAALLLAPSGGADLALEAGDLARDAGLRTAIMVSLFSDGRAPDGFELPEGEDDPRGWWPDTPEDRFGSLLWTLAREKATPEVAARARETARRALAWLEDEEIAERVEVTASYPLPAQLELRVVLYRGRAARWAHLWRGVEDYEGPVAGLLLKVEARR